MDKNITEKKKNIIMIMMKELQDKQKKLKSNELDRMISLLSFYLKEDNEEAEFQQDSSQVRREGSSCGENGHIH